MIIESHCRPANPPSSLQGRSTRTAPANPCHRCALIRHFLPTAQEHTRSFAMAAPGEVGDGLPDLQHPGGRFLTVRELGRGSFGHVLLAQDVLRNGEVAVKRMERAALNAVDDRRYLEGELLNHSQLFHPHVVQFREVYLGPHHINIVMEYANSGTLFEYVRQQRTRRLNEPTARWFFQQLILAVDYCHRKGVCNRDIKLENTLLQAMPGVSRPLLKVCDFGYAKHDDRSAPDSKVGTYAYMAPEVMTTQQAGPYDGKAADVFSCGVVLFAMLAGRYPFRAPNPTDPGFGLQLVQMQQAMNNQHYELPDGLSNGCKSMLQRMLRPNPTQRITVAGIMADPWFLDHLPAAALGMNDTYLAKARVVRQSEADIRTIAAAV